MTLDSLRREIIIRRYLPPPAQRRALRQAAGLSLRAFADHLGCSPEAVRHWEAGDRYPSREHLATYAEALSILAGSESVAE